MLKFADYGIFSGGDLMGVKYEAVLWNRQKKSYDIILWGMIVGILLVFVVSQFLMHPLITLETLIIRATALTAFVLLHLILMIGPLARLDHRFLPLLYNRRHLGVSMFLIALVHGAFSIIQFHALGDVNPIVSVFTSNQNYQAISEFPFQILGFFALIILFLMAATSHDFWLKNLSPKIWKTLHISVYLAYALLIAHVATGALQYENHPAYWAILILGFASVTGLHFTAGFNDYKRLTKEKYAALEDGFVEVCTINEIQDDCAKTVFINGENIAIFKYDGNVSAVHNVCKHQMGPLGEGKIVDGCITCPWHGYQYLPQNGQAPAPFTETLHTYIVKVIGSKVWVHPTPKPEGTFIEPAKVEQT
ncbi:MAG: ferric reductase-like transmembrane domain-containing protein [Balneolaceae bacterium]|nr:ferric reductase-like transmembrane domain-containing protein [Balneolaceae bacterium]